MASIATWTNHKTNPQVFGPLNMKLPLFANLSTQTESVTFSGSTAIALVAVSGVCKFTDEARSCVDTPAMPKRAFRTKVRVTLSSSGIFATRWQVVRTEEDVTAARARKEALSTDVTKRGDAQRKVQDRIQLTQQLMLAVELDDEPAALKALREGADPNMSVERAGMRTRFRFPVLNETALHLAIHFKRLSIVRLLMEHGANLNQRGAESFGRGNDDLTPLRQAIMNQQPEIVSLLLGKGADPNLDRALADALECAPRSDACRRIVTLFRSGPRPVDEYFGPRPPSKDRPYVSNRQGVLTPLEACSAQASKDGSNTVYSFQGQRSPVRWSTPEWPVAFYVDYSNGDVPRRRQAGPDLLMITLAEKVGRREAVQMPEGFSGYVAKGEQVTPNIWRFETQRGRSGQYWLKAPGLQIDQTFFCFEFVKF